jgi:hypothetical protein
VHVYLTRLGTDANWDMFQRLVRSDPITSLLSLKELEALFRQRILELKQIETKSK